MKDIVHPCFPKRGLKSAKRPFSVKKCTSLEESLLQSFSVNTVSDKVVGHSLAYLSVQNWFVEDVAFYVTNLVQTDRKK